MADAVRDCKQFELAKCMNTLVSATEHELGIDSEIINSFCRAVPARLKSDPTYAQIRQALVWQVRLSFLLLYLTKHSPFSQCFLNALQTAAPNQAADQILESVFPEGAFLYEFLLSMRPLTKGQAPSSREKWKQPANISG